MTNKMHVLHLTGNNYSIGFKYGRALSADIQRNIRLEYKALEQHRNISFDRALQISLKYRPYVKKYFPEYLEEIRGIADGANVPFGHVFLINTIYELAFNPEESCSALAVSPKCTEDGQLYIAQNVDVGPSSPDLNLLLHLKQKGKPEIFMLTSAGVIGFIGFNEVGHAHVSNTVLNPHWTYGIPHHFFHRKLLESSSCAECAALAHKLPIASSGNHIVSDHEGNIVDLEMIPTAVNEMHSSTFLVHTNHFTSEGLKKYECFHEELECSRFRLNRLHELIDNNIPINKEKIMGILSDHKNFPKSLCRHFSDTGYSMSTKASLIMEPLEKRMHIAFGNPCSAVFHSYDM